MTSGTSDWCSGHRSGSPAATPRSLSAPARRRPRDVECWRSDEADRLCPDPTPSRNSPSDVRPLGLVLFAERLRSNAAETVAFFADQGVELRVLSGDAPATAGAIARDAGVPGSAPALDGEALPSDPAELREAVLSAPAVGRISPEGKRAVVAALADAGRYVAMIGDGVNDVPALKEARLAIAQGSGTQMSRSVADLVLVRDDFGVVPGMVAEGRQILRNIQRVARLFVTKTVFTATVGLAVAIPTGVFPLLPRQFSIASTVTIGIPAFLLALAPSSGRWRPDRYLQSVARFAIRPAWRSGSASQPAISPRDTDLTSV